MALEFIDIKRSHHGNVDTSTLAISDRYPDALRVLGGLPHASNFRPATAADRDRLVDWLESLDYDEPGPEPEPEPVTLDYYISRIDDVHVIHVDTPGIECNAHGPRCRIYLNDDTENPIWWNNTEE